MALNLDPIRPYLWAVKLLLSALLLSFVFVKGCQHGVASEAVAHGKALASKDKTIAAKDKTLNEAAESLRASARILREVNAETDRLEREAAAAKKRATDAGAVAAKAQANLDRRIEGFAKALAHARKNPDCDALLSANVRNVCDL